MGTYPIDLPKCYWNIRLKTKAVKWCCTLFLVVEHIIWYLVSYGNLCHHGNFQMTLLINKWTNIGMDDGWVHSLAKTLPSLVNNLWWNIVMDDQILNEKLLGKRQKLQHCKSIIPQNTYKEWQIMLGYHFVLVTLYYSLQLVLSKTMRIGDTKHHILCSEWERGD